MAGGTWISQNKVRPGAYINFVSVIPPAMPVGDRGIGTMALPLNWGAQGELIDIYSTDLTDGSSLAKVGLTAFDEDAKLLNLMLSNCYLARIYRLDSGGVKASATDDDLTITAKYSGTFGNNITVQIAEANGAFDVTTWVNGASVHTQTVAAADELTANDFVSFDGIGALSENAGIKLTGGSNGTAALGTAYPAYLGLAAKSRWQVMALTQGNAQYAAQFAAFAKEMRNTEGKYVQVVVANHAAADHIGVINSDCGAVVDGVTVSAEEATAWVAGITGGASVVQSNVGRVFPGASRILNERTNAEIIDALKRGMFILATNQRGQIIAEDDINSLNNFTAELTKDFRLNQIVRVLDEIGTSVVDAWEQSFKGKVQNNADGRMLYKGVIITYLTELQRLGAIDNFDYATDVNVSPGTEKDAVVANLAVQPVAAMSKLYMTVFVS